MPPTKKPAKKKATSRPAAAAARKAKAPAAKAKAPRAKKKAPAKKRVRIPFAELRARKELAERALDDIRNLMAEADPIGNPADFAEREQKALALFEQLHTLLPTAEPLTAKQRAKLEREAAERPDSETLRAVLLEMEKMVDDPAFPPEFREQIDREQIREALVSLDEAELLMPIARATAALAAELSTPKVHDPRLAALRRETEKLAAKRRS